MPTQSNASCLDFMLSCYLGYLKLLELQLTLFLNFHRHMFLAFSTNKSSYSNLSSKFLTFWKFSQNTRVDCLDQHSFCRACSVQLQSSSFQILAAV